MPAVPAAAAQIHVPNLAPPLPFRVRSAVIVARRRFGVTLLLGAVMLVATTLVSLPSGEAHMAIALVPATWMAALLVGLVTTVRATAWRSHEAPSAKLSWGLFFAGLALMAPLSLHALVQPWEWAPSPYDHIGVRTFGGWVVASMWFTAVPHVVFAGLCFARGYRGDRKPHLALIGVATTFVTLVDCFWWGAYGLLPTIYVGLTTIPLLFGLRRLERMHES